MFIRDEASLALTPNDILLKRKKMGLTDEEVEYLTNNLEELQWRIVETLMESYFQSVFVSEAASMLSERK